MKLQLPPHMRHNSVSRSRSPSPPEQTPKNIPMAQFEATVQDATKRVVQAVCHPPSPAVELAAIEDRERPEPL